MKAWITFALLSTMTPVLAQMPAQEPPISEQQRQLDNYCAIEFNRATALCTARLKGAAKVVPVDLAVHVAKGEAEQTSAITPDEITDCWATWVAISEHIVAKGRGSFPADYTALNLAKRVGDWQAAADKALAGREDYERKATETEMLTKRRDDVAGPRIILAAKHSGNCRRLPTG